MTERRPAPKLKALIPSVIILLICFAVYFSALTNGFVYDDDAQVIENFWIRDMGFIPKLFLTDVWKFYGEGASNYYRPVMHLLYMFNYHIFGLTAWGFHLVNILFHAGVSVLVFLIASRILGKTSSDGPASAFAPFVSPPFLAALLFAVHPINTEAVTWVAGLPELSFTFFSLLSLYLYMRSTDKGNLSMAALFLSSLSFFFAALSKETALMLPVLLAAYDYAFRRDSVSFTGRLKRYAPYLAVAGVYFIMRFNALEVFAPLRRHAELSTYQYVINVFPLFARYLEKLLWPANLSAFYVLQPISKLLSVRGMSSLLVTMVFLTVAFILRKKNPAVFFSLVLIAVPLLPALYIPGLGENSFTERYLYLPSVGFAMLATLGIVRVFSAIGHPAVAKAILFLIIGLFSAGTVLRIPVWKDNLSLWADTLPKAQGSAIPQALMGDALLGLKRYDEAIGHYEAALRINPNLMVAHLNLGVVYKEKGLLDEAIEQFRIASRLNPRSAGAHTNLGVAYGNKGWNDRAIEEFRTALRLNPYLAGAYMALGDVYSSEDMIDEAIAQYQEAIRINPDFADAYNNLGIAYGRKGMFMKAVELFETAAKLRTDEPAYHYNAARAYQEMGMGDKAREHLKRAAELEAGTR